VLPRYVSRPGGWIRLDAQRDSQTADAHVAELEFDGQFRAAGEPASGVSSSKMAALSFLAVVWTTHAVAGWPSTALASG